MCAQQDHALAALERLLQVFEALEARDLRVSAVAGPAAEAHLDQGHAECFEVSRRQGIPFPRRQVGKTELDIAADDGAAAAGEPLGDPAEDTADRECATVRQQAHEPQSRHAQPGRPVAGCPEMAKWLAVVAHADDELKRKW